MSTSLDVNEAKELNNCEDVIARGFETFYEVGQAFFIIRDKKLYRAGFKTFEEYCRQRWGMGASRARQFIGAAEVIENLKSVTNVTLPTNEAQTRELAALDPVAQRLTWETIVNSAPNGKVTAQHCKSVATVFQEMLRTGAIDDGTGHMIANSDLVKAAITEVRYEMMQRQKSHITESMKQRERRQLIAKTPAASLRVGRESGRYRTVVVTPEWTALKKREDDLFNLVPGIAGDDAHLYLWSRHRDLPYAFQLIDKWGFRFECLLTWVKNRGFDADWTYTTEHILFCRRGDFPLRAMGLRLDFQGDVRAGTTPDSFYKLVLTASPGPRVIVFPEAPREQFDSWPPDTDSSAS
jgi:N6-adenosine-specific RNA methylase IME4